jgi:ATP-binding cassette subfamily D (ALD) long-chain fatty acid import protein
MAPAVSKLHFSSSSLAVLYSQHRPLIQRCLNLSFTIFILATTARGVSGSGRSSSSSSRKSRKPSKDDGNKPARVQVDAVFWQRLRAILRIIIPGIRSKEALLLAMHTSLLILRTAISLYVAALDGK